MATGPHISISAEPLFQIGHLQITNSMLTSLIVSFVMIAFASIVRFKLKSTNKPKGLQNVAEWLIETLQSFIQTITGDAKKTRRFLPFFATFFLFILFNNWFGLLPGVGTIVTTPIAEQDEVTITNELEAIEVTLEEVNQHLETDQHQADPNHEITLQHQVETETNIVNDLDMFTKEELIEASNHQIKAPVFRPGSADLNTTLALAITSVIATQIFGLMTLKFSYLKKFFNLASPIDFFVGLLELISEFAKIISFAFRLFGNIFAGEVLLVVITFLIPVVVPMPFYGLELFVGFIQALVFSMLSLVFFNMATQGHEEH
ncbi:MAG: F0F1 ATP synthase subunit A [Patescibacteria group bacterium]